MKRQARIAILLFSTLIVGILIGLYLVPSHQQNLLVGREHSPSAYKLQNILELIRKDYVETVDMDSLVESVIPVVLEQLDPHSTYLSAIDFVKEQETMNGEFEGIGVQFRIVEDSITIIQTIVGGPSQKVGIMAGDRIITVDDSLCVGETITNTDVIRMLKGEKGSTVKIGVYRRGITQPLSFNVVRDVIPTRSLNCATMLDKKTGYIKLERFASTSHQELLTAISSLLEQGMKQLVFDLRGNGGGYLDQAIKITDEFLPLGNLIVYTKQKDRIRSQSMTTKGGIFEQGKLFVLIDEFSASASEIVSGALQDNDRATILGRRTFGKGLVQEQRPLFDGSAIRLTVAKYYIPSGRSIQRPYVKGNSANYYSDIWSRYISGELDGTDSILHLDTSFYSTKEGRRVFGGGGIEPDIQIPYQRIEKDSLYATLLQKGILLKFCFDYVDRNRKSLQKYPDGETFIREFVADNDLLNEMMAYAHNQGIKESITKRKDKYIEILTLMKAYIAQNLYDDKTFYDIYLPIDPDMKVIFPLLAE